MQKVFPVMETKAIPHELTGFSLQINNKEISTNALFSILQIHTLHTNYVVEHAQQILFFWIKKNKFKTRVRRVVNLPAQDLESLLTTVCLIPKKLHFLN